MQALVFGCLFRYERNVLGKNGGQIRNEYEKLAQKMYFRVIIDQFENFLVWGVLSRTVSMA